MSFGCLLHITSAACTDYLYLGLYYEKMLAVLSSTVSRYSDIKNYLKYWKTGFLEDIKYGYQNHCCQPSAMAFQNQGINKYLFPCLNWPSTIQVYKIHKNKKYVYSQ